LLATGAPGHSLERRTSRLRTLRKSDVAAVNLVDLWLWLDFLGIEAFQSANTLEARAFYAEWYAALADELTVDIEPRI